MKRKRRIKGHRQAGRKTNKSRKALAMKRKRKLGEHARHPIVRPAGGESSGSVHRRLATTPQHWDIRHPKCTPAFLDQVIASNRENPATLLRLAGISWWTKWGILRGHRQWARRAARRLVKTYFEPTVDRR